MKKATLCIEFPSQDHLESFASWLMEGGGEDEFHETLEIEDLPPVEFTYHNQDGVFLPSNLIRATPDTDS